MFHRQNQKKDKGWMRFRESSEKSREWMYGGKQTRCTQETKIKSIFRCTNLRLNGKDEPVLNLYIHPNLLNLEI